MHGLEIEDANCEN